MTFKPSLPRKHGEDFFKEVYVMPIISAFYGIIIRMYFNDHAPPHFHVQYGDERATINIERCELMEGRLSKRALAMVMEWTSLHHDALIEDWRLCMEKQRPKPIDPLD